MKKEQKKQSDELYKFLYSFNKKLNIEEDQMNMDMNIQDDGRTPQ